MVFPINNMDDMDFEVEKYKYQMKDCVQVVKGFEKNEGKWASQFQENTTIKITKFPRGLGGRKHFGLEKYDYPFEAEVLSCDGRKLQLKVTGHKRGKFKECRIIPGINMDRMKFEVEEYPDEMTNEVEVVEGSESNKENSQRQSDAPAATYLGIGEIHRDYFKTI